MGQPNSKTTKSEDDLIAAILKVKPTADMPKSTKRKQKTARARINSRAPRKLWATINRADNSPRNANPIKLH